MEPRRGFISLGKPMMLLQLGSNSAPPFIHEKAIS
jgi:hypothetical protein